MAARIPPPSHSPLITLPTLVIAVKTTGGEPEQQRLLCVSAIAMQGSAALDQPRINQMLDPGVELSGALLAELGIGSAANRHQPNFASFAKILSDALAGRVVVGYEIGDTLAVLQREAEAAGIVWRAPPALDIEHLARVMEPTGIDNSLQAVATRLNVAIEDAGAEQTMGKCAAIARIWGKLLGLLREADIRTLGEAYSFAEQRAEPSTRDTEADWFDGTAKPPRVQPGAPGTRIDSYAFQRRLRDLMSAPPMMIVPGTTLRETARAMCQHRIGALLVGTADQPPRGIVTERDLLRVTAEGVLDIDRTLVADVMTSPVECMAGNEMLYRALGRMDRLGIRHLCVVDPAGVAVGMLSQRNLLQHRARNADMLGDEIARANDDTALAAAYGRVPEIASRLVSEGLDGLTVARFISGELRALTARAAEMVIADMLARGLGAAPAPWCLLVLGSGGRGESLMGTDQDNALIHAGTAADDAWFETFGAGLADLLDTAGVPRCKGEVMVVTPQWRGTEAEWTERIGNWLRRAKPEDMLNIDIFFDLVPVAGDARMARRLHGEAVRMAARNLPFIGLMAESVNGVAPRLGFMGALPSKEGRIDLKRDGLLPLVCLARTLALRVGSTARSTPERLRDAVAAERLPNGDAATLIELHVQLLTLMLHQQLADLEAGRGTSSRVELKELNRDQRSSLKYGLKHLDTVVRELRATIAG